MQLTDQSLDQRFAVDRVQRGRHGIAERRRRRSEARGKDDCILRRVQSFQADRLLRRTIRFVQIALLNQRFQALVDRSEAYGCAFRQRALVLERLVEEDAKDFRFPDVHEQSISPFREHNPVKKGTQGMRPQTSLHSVYAERADPSSVFSHAEAVFDFQDRKRLVDEHRLFGDLQHVHACKRDVDQDACDDLQDKHRRRMQRQ